MPNSIHETHAMDPEEILAAGGEPLRAGWLERSLREAVEHSEEDSTDEHEFKLAAAREMVLDLAPPGVAAPDERVLASLFVCAYNSTTIWLGRAGSRHLPRDARETAQRFACRLMDITARLQGTLARAAAERRKAEEMAERWAIDRALRAREAERERERAVPPPVPFDLDNDLDNDLDDGLEDDLDSGQSIPRADRFPSGTNPAAASSPPLNRRQRRALARKRRKAATAAPKGP